MQDVPVLLEHEARLQQDAEILHYDCDYELTGPAGDVMSRKQRLPLEAYEIEGSAWHVTVSVDRNRGAPFRDIESGRLVLKYWLNGCYRAAAVPHLICLMPDHLHMIVEVGPVGLIEVMRRLKSHSTVLYSTRTGASTVYASPETSNPPSNMSCSIQSERAW